MYQVGSENLRAIRKLRTNKNRKHDFFRPMDLYLVHTPPRILKFKVDNRTYEIEAGLTSKGLGWNGLELKVEPIATIRFDKPTSVDDALIHVWEWKRFYSQVAMEVLMPEAIAARVNRRSRSTELDLYFPNIPTRNETRRGGLHLHPGDIPYNLWKDRKELADVMQQWLSKEKERRIFRVALDQVLDRMAIRIDIGDIVSLCGGIESLSELNEGSPISKEDIDKLAKGATRVAQEEKIGVTADRIHGLLGMLRQQSLPRRLNLMSRQLRSVVDKADCKLLTKAALELRTTAAHGRSIAENSMPKIGPTVEGLAAFCALFDLTSCLMPKMANEHSQLYPLQTVVRSINYLRNLN